MARTSGREGVVRARKPCRAAVAAAISVGVAFAGLSGAGAQTAGNGKGKASGDPIVIGAYTPKDNPTFTAPELLSGIQAAANYVNNDLDGIGGRPIKLVTCATDQTAPGLTACGSKLFQQNPLMIIPGPDAAAFTVQSVFDATGIPLIGGASFTPPEYTSPSRAVFNGFSASLFPAMVHFATGKLHGKKLATISLDISNNSIIKSVFMDPIAQANGLPKPPAVVVPVGTADLTSSVAAALQTKPDVLVAYGLPCLPFFQAYRSLGAKIPVVLPDNCADSATLKAAGASADGMYFISLYNGNPTTPQDKDVQLYTKEMNKYAKGAADTDFSRAGFGTVMNIHALLGAADAKSLTHQSVLAAFKGAKNQPNFLNTPYNCVSPPVPKYPAICAGSAFMMRQVHGRLQQLTPFQTMDVLYGNAATQ